MRRQSSLPRQRSLPPLASEVQQLRALLPAPERRPRPGGRERNVQVLCRFRSSGTEESRGSTSAWDLQESRVSAKGETSGLAPGLPTFAFDRVFGPETKQAEVFASVAPVVQGVLKGVNGAVLCYGQTSAGKTFTMEGLNGGQGELAGIIPRALSAIFEAASLAEGQGTCKLTLSMLEVYMERLRDLLDPESDAELRLVEDRSRGVQVCGLREVAVTSLQSALDVFHSGQRNRCVAATGMNDRSSRSHSVFMLRVEWPSGQQNNAKLYLVDLAGSECLKKACFRGGEDAAMANAEIVEEAKAINQSLTTLGLVISRLADKRRAGVEQHVPYRSSKLTRVLQDTLGGSSHTVLVVNCASSPQHACETLSTLRFGARARSVVNVVSAGSGAEESLLLQTLRAARQEIQRLRSTGSTAIAGETSATGPPVGSWSMVSALTPCSEGPPSPLEVSPASRRVSRGTCLRPQLDALWEHDSGTELSPINGRKSPKSLSPLQLTPRRSAAASLVPSRRVSRNVPWSRRVSLALTEDGRDGELSPLELSPGTSVAVSRRASRGGRRLSRVQPTSPESTPKKERSMLDASPTTSVRATPGRMQRRWPMGRDPVLRYWEHPMTRQETFERLLLVRANEVDKLEQQLDIERDQQEQRQLQLEEQLAALQTENQWLTADRMQHLEQAVRNSLVGSDRVEEESDHEQDAVASSGSNNRAQKEDLQAALLQEQQRSSNLLSQHEAELEREKRALAELRTEHKAELEREKRARSELRSEHEAMLSKERERSKNLEAALAREQESRSEAQQALASQCDQHSAQLQSQQVRQEQLQRSEEWAAAASSECSQLQKELARMRGELFVEAEARQKACRRAAEVEAHSLQDVGTAAVVQEKPRPAQVSNRRPCLSVTAWLLATSLAAGAAVSWGGGGV